MIFCSKVTVIESRVGLLRVATLFDILQRGYNVAQRDPNVSECGTAWLNEHRNTEHSLNL